MFPFFVSFVLRRKEKVFSCWTKHHLLPVDCSTHTLSLSFLSFSHASDWLAKVLSQFFFLPRHIRSDSVYLWCLWLPCVAKRKSTLLISRAQSHPRIFPNNTRTLTLYFIHPNAQTLFYTHVWTLSLSLVHTKNVEAVEAEAVVVKLFQIFNWAFPKKEEEVEKEKSQKSFHLEIRKE